MKEILKFVILLSLFVFQCSVPSVNVKIDPGFDPKLIKNIAVLEFEPSPGEPSSGEILQESVIEAFKKEGFNVVEKAKVREVFSKLGLKRSSDYNEAELKKIIAELSVDSIVFGKVAEFASSGYTEGLLHEPTAQPMPGATMPYAEYSYTLYFTLNLYHDPSGKTVLIAESRKQGKARTINMKEIGEKAVREIISQIKTSKG